MAYIPPILKFQDFIVVSVNTAGVADRFKHMEDMVHINLLMLYREIADSTTKRMRANVSGPQPYGTGRNGPPIVRRRGRVYETIGYISRKTEDGPFVQMGAIKGSLFGRQLARVHDEGATIVPKHAEHLLVPPKWSPARDSSGDQIMTATQTRRAFYSQWDTADYIWVRRTKGVRPEIAFIKMDKVKIPARHIISREYDHVQSELARKLDTTVQASLRLETVRI